MASENKNKWRNKNRILLKINRKKDTTYVINDDNIIESHLLKLTFTRMYQGVSYTIYLEIENDKLYKPRRERKEKK